MVTRVVPGLAVAMGGALVGAFTAVGWWIIVVGMTLIALGLVLEYRQSERREIRLLVPAFQAIPAGCHRSQRNWSDSTISVWPENCSVASANPATTSFVAPSDQARPRYALRSSVVAAR